MKLTILVDDKTVYSLSSVIEKKRDEEECMMAEKHSALDVAKYIVNYAINDLKLPITNLKLQKILYFVQLEFLDELGEILFTDDIEAWKYGPVISRTYSHFRKYSDLPITDTFLPRATFSRSEDLIINRVVRGYIRTNEWELVKITHEEGPWKDVYVEGENRIISERFLRDFVEERRSLLEG